MVVDGAVVTVVGALVVVTAALVLVVGGATVVVTAAAPVVVVVLPWPQPVAGNAASTRARAMAAMPRWMAAGLYVEWSFWRWVLLGMSVLLRGAYLLFGPL